MQRGVDERWRRQAAHVLLSEQVANSLKNRGVVVKFRRLAPAYVFLAGVAIAAGLLFTSTDSTRDGLNYYDARHALALLVFAVSVGVSAGWSAWRTGGVARLVAGGGAVVCAVTAAALAFDLAWATLGPGVAPMPDTCIGGMDCISEPLPGAPLLGDAQIVGLLSVFSTPVLIVLVLVYAVLGRAEDDADPRPRSVLGVAARGERRHGRFGVLAGIVAPVLLLPVPNDGVLVIGFALGLLAGWFGGGRSIVAVLAVTLVGGLGFGLVSWEELCALCDGPPTLLERITGDGRSLWIAGFLLVPTCLGLGAYHLVGAEARRRGYPGRNGG